MTAVQLKEGNDEMSLYEDAKENWDKHAGTGFPTLAAMSKQFATQVGMAEALNCSDAAVWRWHHGHRPLAKWEGVAVTWFKSQQRKAALPLFEVPVAQFDISVPEPEVCEGPVVIEQDNHPKKVLMIVRCAREDADTVRRVLGLANCEVEVLP